MKISLQCCGALVVLTSLAGCGGGDGGSLAGNPAPANPTPPTIPYTQGSFLPSAGFAAQCQTPRRGTNPATNQPFVDVQGSELAEKHFLRSWTNELYLWFSEVADRDPASVSGVLAYFDTLKTNATTTSGRPKDQFHFTYDTAEYQALSQSGTEVGYGASIVFVRPSPPRQAVVQYVKAGSPIATAGVTRGAELLQVDGVDVVNVATQAGVNAINAGLYEPVNGSSHRFLFRDRGASTTRDITLTAAPVTYDPVPEVRVLPTVMGNLGYLLFNDHTATSEQRLIAAVNQLRTLSVNDLVLDLRYNGGGFLDIASELAYMIAGPGQTAGKVFERVRFNSKHPITNPVTGQPLTPLPFLTTTQGFGNSTGQALPTLNLSRVYVLTSDDTCSASESIINGLRGAGVTVYQFGGVTCGKPYGFYPRDNCGTTYFSIQFQGVNELGFGDYADGFAPVTGVPASQRQLPGCASAESYSRDLGDPEESLLKIALRYPETSGLCEFILSDAAPDEGRVRPSAAAGEGLALQAPAEPWRNNRMLR